MCKKSVAPHTMSWFLVFGEAGDHERGHELGTHGLPERQRSPSRVTRTILSHKSYQQCVI